MAQLVKIFHYKPSWLKVRVQVPSHKLLVNKCMELVKEEKGLPYLGQHQLLQQQVVPKDF